MKPLTPATPHVIVMVGIPGAGKSTFADHFAKTFLAPVVNQRQISQTIGVEDETAANIASMMLDELFKTHRTLIYEGPTHTKTSRADIAKRIRAAGYQPLLVWVQTESVEAMRRATKRGGLTDEEFEAALKRFHPPLAAEKAVVISGKHTYASQLKIILKHLAGQQRSDNPELPRSRPVRGVILR